MRGLGWTLVAALSTVALVLWITAVNLLYLLLQIATAAEDIGFGQALRSVARFVRVRVSRAGGVFLVVFGMLVAATLASALAWSGVGLIAFVPLVGLAVFPLQIAALLIRGLVFEYIGLTAMGAYITLYRRFAARDPLAAGVPAGSAPAGAVGGLREEFGSSPTLPDVGSMARTTARTTVPASRWREVNTTIGSATPATT